MYREAEGLVACDVVEALEVGGAEVDSDGRECCGGKFFDVGEGDVSARTAEGAEGGEREVADDHDEEFGG